MNRMPPASPAPMPAPAGCAPATARFRRPPGRYSLLAGLLAALLAACNQTEQKPAEDVRPVRTITVQRGDSGEQTSLAGRILAQDEVSLAFRISGRMIERAVNVGDHVKAGQLIARLEPDNEQNALQAARASLAAAEGQLVQARNHYQRQESLLQRGFTTRAAYDQAAQAQQTAQAQVDAARAQMETAENQLNFTQLFADSAGTVTARGAEPGEVVQAGRMIVQLARQGGRDAVFDVPGRLIRALPANAMFGVSLSNEPQVRATGRVREVSPQADPVTGTFQVRVGLSDPPAAMMLGATVTGRVTLGTGDGLDIPASALTRSNQQPAVWVVDPQSRTVALRNVEVSQFRPASVTVSGGLAPGDIVVTAGVQSLHPDQKVRLLGSEL